MVILLVACILGAMVILLVACILGAMWRYVEIYLACWMGGSRLLLHYTEIKCHLNACLDVRTWPSKMLRMMTYLMTMMQMMMQLALAVIQQNSNTHLKVTNYLTAAARNPW
jgi:hypothetical protein